jgi:threonine synthase
LFNYKTGYAKDGGLYFPESIPTVCEDEKASWSRLSFQDLAVEVLKKFIDSEEIPHEEMKQLVAKAYEKFLTGNCGSKKTFFICEDVITL